MKFFRYRRPSLKTLLGVTKAKKQLKKQLGITQALKPVRAWGNAKRRVKRKLGYESPAMRMLRNGPPTPGGCLVIIAAASLVIGTGVLLAFRFT